MTSLETLAHNFGTVFVRLHRVADRRMAEQGASLARTKILMFLQKFQGSARATDIAECFGQAPRTITEALDALERDHLIVRTADPSDRRVKRLSITPAGEAAVRATEPLRLALIEQLFGALDEEDRARLDAMLERLLARLEEVDPQ